MGIRSFIRGIREEIFPETIINKLEELEELDRKMSSFRVSKDTIVFKKQAEVDFNKAILQYVCNKEKEKEIE